MDWNILIVIGPLTLVLWWLVKPIRDTLVEVEKNVKQNGERIAKIEGIIWADIDKARREGIVWRDIEKAKGKGK